MKYLFDTDTISLFFDDTRTPYYNNIHSKVMSLKDSDDIVISVLNLFELEYSLVNAPKAKQSRIKNTIEKAENFFTVLSLGKESAHHFGTLKHEIKEEKNWNREEVKRHNIDIMLASTAITENAILVSPDKLYSKLAEINKDFKVENWAL